MFLKFVTRTLAVFGALFFLIILYATYAIVTLRSAKPVLPGSTILVVDLDREIKESPGGGLEEMFSDNNLYLPRLTAAIDRAAGDSRIKGLSLEFGSASLPLAQAEELRDAVKRFAETDKPVMAYADSYGEMAPANGNVLLAGAADRVWLQPVGLVGLFGVAAEVPLGRGLLDKLSISPQVFQRYEGKSFANSFTQTDLTPAHAEEMGDLIRDLNATLVEKVAADRGLPPAKVTALMAEAPLDAEMALREKLITDIGYRDQFTEAMTAAAGTDTRTVITRYIADAGPQAETKLAVVTVTGMIQRGKSDPTGTFGGSGGDTVARALKDAASDKDIAAIILRIDSGGGSPTASETIRRAVVQAKVDKPVIVSMGGAAASGGYWIAADATKIVAQPSTLTGSLGVFGGKVSLEGFWRSIGVNWALVSATPNGGMSSFNHPFNENETRRLNVLFDTMHADFRDRVMTGRGLSAETVRSLTTGRAYSGRRALDLKLVDALGGIDTAVKLALAELDKTGPVTLVDFPKELPFPERLLRGLYNVQSSAGSIGALAGRIEAEAKPLTAIAPAYGLR